MTTSTHRCSRGQLLERYRREVRRASQYMGTRGMGPAGTKVIEEARGGIIRELMRKWGVRRVINHVGCITDRLQRAERAEVT